MSDTRIAVVTGGNKGIGLAIARNVAKPQSRPSGADPQLVNARSLSEQGGPTDIALASFDVGDSQSIKDFEEFIQRAHPSGIDIAINNAGVAFDGFDSTVVKNTLAVNYYGTVEATQMFLRHLRPGGRLVNVSSTASSLGKYSEPLRQAFVAAAQQTTPDATTKLMGDFARAVEEGRETAGGWPSAAYAVSKAGCTAATMALSRGEEARGSRLLVNACCPGWVNTDMTKGRGTKTPDQGAQTPVLLALGDIKGVTGEYWKDEKVVKWSGV